MIGPGPMTLEQRERLIRSIGNTARAKRRERSRIDALASASLLEWGMARLARVLRTLRGVI